MRMAFGRLMVLVLAGGIPAAAGCGGAAQLRTQPIPSGVVATDGVVIEGAGFRLQAGERFTPPFESHCWNQPTEQDRLMHDDVIVHGFAQGRAWGARPVRVTVPGHDSPLHGLLMLCGSVDRSYGPGSRSHRIVVPDEYVRGAGQGRISVVYERQLWGIGGSWYTWVLWLSEDDVF